MLRKTMFHSMALLKQKCSSILCNFRSSDKHVIIRKSIPTSISCYISLITYVQLVFTSIYLFTINPVFQLRSHQFPASVYFWLLYVNVNSFAKFNSTFLPLLFSFKDGTGTFIYAKRFATTFDSTSAKVLLSLKVYKVLSSTESRKGLSSDQLNFESIVTHKSPVTTAKWWCAKDAPSPGTAYDFGEIALIRCLSSLNYPKGWSFFN